MDIGRSKRSNKQNSRPARNHNKKLLDQFQAGCEVKRSLALTFHAGCVRSRSLLGRCWWRKRANGGEGGSQHFWEEVKFYYDLTRNISHFFLYVLSGLVTELKMFQLEAGSRDPEIGILTSDLISLCKALGQRPPFSSHCSRQFSSGPMTQRSHFFFFFFVNDAEMPTTKAAHLKVCL